MNANMILSEPIINAFTSQSKDKYEKDWHNAYIHTKNAFEYRVTEGDFLL